jgi:exosortase K
VIRLALVLTVALGLKLHYAAASVVEIGWILRPTAAAVEAMTGLPFDLEREHGFVHRPLAFAIGKPCAGVNFLIIAFVMLALCTAWPLIGCAGAAYLAAIAANAVRIALTVARMQWLPDAPDPERLHRLEGVVVYFASLALLYMWATSKRSLLVPCMCYLSIALLLPWLNGAANDPRFFEHAAWVCAVPLTFEISQRALRKIMIVRRRELG